MCKFSIPTVKTVMNASDVYGKINLPNTGIEDTYLFIVSIEQVMNYCYQCRSQCPAYEPNTPDHQGYDCDKFALDLAAFVRRKKLTNALWAVWGTHNGTRHAWNLAYCDDGSLYEVEPQNGELWVFQSNPAYKATILK